MMMFSNPRSTLIPALALWLAGALGCQSKGGPQLPPQKGEDAPPPPTIPSLGELSASAAETGPTAAAGTTGTLRARNRAELGPKETGVIAAIPVDEGDAVKKGQLLFKLDAATATLAVEQAQAALGSARVQLGVAKTDFERTRALRERGSATPDAFDQAKARFDGAQSAVAQAQAALDLARRRAQNLAVYSPIDGTVVERRMNVGETATMMPPSIVLVVQDLELLELRARLPEVALKHVREGSQIDARFPAIDESRRVTVKRISPTVDARTRTIEVVADVDNPDHRLKAGMLAEVSFEGPAQEKSDAPTTDETRTAAKEPSDAPR